MSDTDRSRAGGACLGEPKKKSIVESRVAGNWREKAILEDYVPYGLCGPGSKGFIKTHGRYAALMPKAERGLDVRGILRRIMRDGVTDVGKTTGPGLWTDRSEVAK